MGRSKRGRAGPLDVPAASGFAATPDSATSRSQRQLRIGEAIRHALSETLTRGHLRDPELQGASITVTEVRVSPDLRNATAFVLPLGGRNGEAVVAALDRAGAYLRREVAHQVRLRYAPDLRFQLDTSFDQAARIDTLLRRPAVAADLDRGEDESEGGESKDG